MAGEVFAPLEMGAALEALATILVRRGITSPPVAAPPADPLPPPPARDQPLTQRMLWDRLCVALTPGNVVLADQGTSFYGMADHRLPHGVIFIGQPLWGSIGYTLPAAVGAAVAHPDRRTVLLIGDGAAQLTVQELGTFSREGLSPVIVVVNNDGYTVERAIHGETAPYNDIVELELDGHPQRAGGGRSPGVPGADLWRTRRRIHRGRGAPGPHGVRRSGPAAARDPAPARPTRRILVAGRRPAELKTPTPGRAVRSGVDDRRIAWTVRRQRPHSAPAPQACATSLVVDAPAATASATAWLLTPLHRHTHIERSAHSGLDAHHVEELARRTAAGRRPLPPRKSTGRRRRDARSTPARSSSSANSCRINTSWSSSKAWNTHVFRMPAAVNLSIAAADFLRSGVTRRQRTRSRPPPHRGPPGSMVGGGDESSTISPAKTAGMSSTPTASNQSKKTRDRSNSTIGSRLCTPIITSTRP